MMLLRKAGSCKREKAEMGGYLFTGFLPAQRNAKGLARVRGRE